MFKHTSNDREDTRSDSDAREDAMPSSSEPAADEEPEADIAVDVKDEDDRIGLTEAFAPIEDEVVRKARAAGDEHIGLTEAFAPVGEGVHAGGFSYQGDNDDSYPDALQSLEPPDRPPILAHDDSVDRAADKERVTGRHGAEDPIPAYQRKSRRMRRILTGVIIVLVVILAAALVCVGMLVVTESQSAVQMASSAAQQSDDDLTGGVDDATGAEKTVTAPDLASLIGMAQDDALAAVGHGATVTASVAVNEEGNPVKTSLTVALTEEPGDSRSGTPTVYLGLDERGAVVQAGYSAPTSSLGFGSLSFADAVSNEHVVEQTLREAGVPVEDGAAVLPQDKAAYSEYDSAGTTLVRERCTFNGDVDIAGAARTWSATLSYDYTSANASDNLANTIRIIYVYVNAA